jgi:hypothetical protein
MGDRHIKLNVQAAIHREMEKFVAGSYVQQSEDRIYSDGYDKLSRQQIDQGVIALVLECNLSGGSVSDVDLYKLVRNYLWYPEARNEMNAVVRRYGS